MKNVAYMMVFCVSLWALAAEDKIILQSLDPDEDLSSYSDKDFKKIKGIKESTYKSDLPTIEARNEAFKQAGLEAEVKPMDELDRDMFYRFAGRLSPPDLMERYPKISKEKLQKLQTLIQTGTK